ncbi:hypothetical protein [Butyrivibrio proteoclasticus]|uniref:hypothetical protein n=1 Tax=Butyrivibrio proteoclasticus TaxID=43305 RepID=UPI0004796761|nr:hypothetical protein [Butyrivibrio proteoclasticus]
MTIYIICPFHRVTGGVELAHQLCYAINTLTDVKAFMWYINIDNCTQETIIVDHEPPVEYVMYQTECAKSFQEIDREENVVVVPESMTVFMKLIDHAKMALWWMSVDNFLDSVGKESYDFIAQNVSMNLYQSYYSMDFVNKNIPGAKGMFLSDYINQQHGQFIYPPELRKNYAIYNPSKGFAEIEPLIKKTNWIEWIALKGMDREKMILVMQMSKIYVDFGHHPGKDRIPREAAANGCCVITNRKGAAGFHEDVPIPEKYKFENTADSLDEIEALMHEICDDFAPHQAEFASYREMIKGEKGKFDSDVCKFVDEMRKV